jgi:hypothetical protein
MLPFFILVIATSVLRSSVLLDCIRWGGWGTGCHSEIFETARSLTQSNPMCLMFQARARENNSERS